MKYLFLLSLALSLFVEASCIENGYNEPINYWYYHSTGENKCIERLSLTPLETICNNENKRNVHFVSRGEGNGDWFYYEYSDKKNDKLMFNEDGLTVNKLINLKGSKTSINLKKSKRIQFCDQPFVEIDQKNCASKKIDVDLKNEIALTIMQYLFSNYQMTEKSYKEVLVDSNTLSIISLLGNTHQRTNATSYRFNNFLSCGDVFTVDLVSYSAPKAGSKKLFVLKFKNGGLEIVREELIWVS